MTISTADLCDQYAEKLQIALPIFQHYGGVKQFFGRIHTVNIYNDNVLVREALLDIPSNSVLVVDGKASTDCALLGDMLAKIAVERHVSGIVINGYVRDSNELSQLPIGVYALGTMPLKSKKEGKGTRNEPVTFANVTFVPGDYVYVDHDGLIVSEKPLNI